MLRCDVLCVVLCCVVWCGVVWCGVVWCGVVWCGVVWCGVVWCDVVAEVRGVCRVVRGAPRCCGDAVPRESYLQCSDALGVNCRPRIRGSTSTRTAHRGKCSRCSLRDGAGTCTTTDTRGGGTATARA
jgi:hypothetical protein